MMCAFAIAAAPAIARWALGAPPARRAGGRPSRVWWLAAIGNSGAMTLYLWHIPPLLAMHLVFDYLVSCARNSIMNCRIGWWRIEAGR